MVTLRDLSITPLVVIWKNTTTMSRATSMPPLPIAALIVASALVLGVRVGDRRAAGRGDFRGRAHSTTSSAPARASRMMADMTFSGVASLAGISAAICPAAMT